MNLPRAYIDFVKRAGNIESPLTCEFPSYMRLWPLDEVEQYNREYEVPKYAPGFLCFGSNGGGELLAFDDHGAVFAIPAIGMEPKYATPVAESWCEFECYIEAT